MNSEGVGGLQMWDRLVVGSVVGGHVSQGIALHLHILPPAAHPLPLLKIIYIHSLQGELA